MKKLALKLDDLAVESFATDEKPDAERGTVHGHYGTNHTDMTCDQISCFSGCNTCLC